MKSLDCFRLKHSVVRGFLLVLLMVPYLCTASYAYPISYFEQTADSQSSLNAQLSVTQIGRLAVPRGVVNIDGNDVEVQAIPEGLFDPRPVLNGVIINSQATAGKIKGLTYFFSGPWLNYLSQPPGFELVETTAGALVNGRILDGDEKSLTVVKADGTKVTVDFKDIANIQSPRAFSFLIVVSSGTAPQSIVMQGDAKTVLFNSNNGGQLVVATKRPLIKLMGDEQGVKKSEIASFLALDFVALVAPMIAAPLVLGRGNNSARALEASVNKLNAGQ